MSKNIESHQIEDRIFKPSKEFAKKARISSMAEYKKLWKESVDKPTKFWAREAKELSWQKKWKKVLEWKAPDAKWFVGGKLNVSESCVDQHANGPRRNKAAIIFEGEPGDKRVITYAQLHREVCKWANILIGQGIKPKDRVLIYMPMIPEAAFAMLACARIGAVHSVVFGGFSADSIADRLEDSEAEHIITADGGWRRGKIVPLKDNVDDAIAKNSSIKSVIVVKRTAQESFTPEAFVLRRSMPWAEGNRGGLVFTAFGHSFSAYEALLGRMCGAEDGIVDALFTFSEPETGAYFWCPPMHQGRLDLRAVGMAGA